MTFPSPSPLSLLLKLRTNMAAVTSCERSIMGRCGSAKLARPCSTMRVQISSSYFLLLINHVKKYAPFNFHN